MLHISMKIHVETNFPSAKHSQSRFIDDYLHIYSILLLTCVTRLGLSKRSSRDGPNQIVTLTKLSQYDYYYYY